MKLQIDTINKTIKLENSIKLRDLVKNIKKLLPDDWQDFTLETHTVINNWNTPYIIERWKEIAPYRPNYYPWYSSSAVLCKSDLNGTSMKLTSGVYNVECKL